MPALATHRSDTGYKSVSEQFVSLSDIEENIDIDTSKLNIEKKTRSNLLPWKGQFSPQLIEVLLGKYAKKGDVVLDPFLGSGTLIVEAARKGLSAKGCEINPAAYHLSSLYTFCNTPIDQRKEILNTFEKRLDLVDSVGMELFHLEGRKGQFSLGKLLEAGRSLDCRAEQVLFNALIVKQDLVKEKKSREDFLRTWRELKSLVSFLPYTDKPIDIRHEDARSVSFSDNEFDLVVTSPPYINVFNYHQQYRRSVEALDHDVLEAARSEIGSNRKNRGNRFLTVIQYVIEMASVLKQLQRICKENGRIIFIVGRESNVKKTRFYNSEIIASISRMIGLKIESRQERCFTNRFGQIIYEDILHFINVPSYSNTSDEHFRKLAVEVLTNAIDRASNESKSDLLDAINRVSEVVESPIFVGA